MNTMKQIFMMLAIVCLAGTANAQVGTDAKKINITNTNVYAKDAKVIIEWATDGNTATYNWEVQRSFDAREFATIAWVLGPDPSKEGDNYQYKDLVKTNKNQTVYYRLKHISQDGSEQYSEIITTSTK